MRRTILIVDDQQINRRLLAKILGNTYNTQEAADGSQALALLRADKEKISAVLLDLIMPVMDGYEVLRAMQADDRLAGIPVIVASQADKSESEGKALQFGARDFIGKPYVPEVLLRRLANLIELYESNTCIVRMERDALTGLYSKEAFLHRAAALLEAHPEEKYILIATDVERFKLVNDSFGTDAGDRLLRYIAQGMRKAVEEEGGLCARHSADHFVTLVPRAVDDGHLKTIIATAEKNLAGYDLPMKISLKMGVYPIEKNDVPVEIMCDRAILAAESVKGRYNSVCAYYDDSIRQRLLREQQITDAVKGVLPSEQFMVYLQPKYDLASEKIAGAEALVRWNHPQLGFMSPGEFIPLFEQNGYITELDRFVWDKTAEIIESWARTGKKIVPVSVNVSRQDIYQVNLPEILMEIVDRHGIRPGQLHLEITETAYTRDPQQLIQVVNRLKELGFVIEMDDFGSGYSSLNMLSELPIDMLKLDMRFIQKQADQNTSRNILSFIISLAKWMNLLVVAEGVETKEQIDLLRNMDCNYVQGFYYAKPMPHQDFTQMAMGSEHAAPIVPSVRDWNSGDITTHTSKNGKVMLVVDDIETDRAILVKYFQDTYTVVEANNGQVAYEYAQQHFDEIAVILLDLIMPVMDGFQFLKKLRGNALLQDIPVVVTSLGNDGSETKAFEVGATEFLAKPYNREIAIHRVQNVAMRNAMQTLEREKRMLAKMNTLAQEAKLDSLTGLYNRMEMERRVQSYFAREIQPGATFLMLDLDSFKSINDAYGHEAGDEAIRKTAELLKKEFRESDSVCRMGGDEFAVFIESPLTGEMLTRKLNSLQKQLHFTIRERHVTCSIGACTAPDFARDYQELYHNADMALLTAKRLGKDRYQIYGGSAELPANFLYRDMDWLLDESSDAVFICDAETYKLYYMNDVACALAGGKDKAACIGKPCYEMIWGRTEPCTHCVQMEKLSRTYSEREFQPDGSDKTYIIKGKLIDWGNRKARVQYVQDNTHRAAMARKMEELSQDRQLLLDLLPGGVFRYGKANDHFNFVSENLLRMLGYTREEFDEKFGGKFSNLVWHEDRERTLAEIDDQQSRGNYDECQYRIEKKDGTLCWVYDAGYLHPTPEGGEYYVVIMDITRQKTVQQENERLTALLETLLDNVPGGICLYHWNGRKMRVLQVSRQFSEVFGLDAEKELRRSIDPNSETVHPEDRADLRQTVDAMLFQGSDVDCAFRIVNPRGPGWRWVRMQAAIRKKTEGEALIYALYTDVTELYQLRNALSEQRDMLAAAIEHSGMRSWVCDFQQKQNDEVFPAELAKLAAAFAHGGRVGPEDVQRYRTMIRDLRDGEKRATLDIAVSMAGGGRHWLRLMYSVISSGADGGPVRAIATARDVTAEKVTEQNYAEESAYLNALSAGLVASYRINLDTGVVEEARSRLAMISEPEKAHFTDAYFRQLCTALIPPKAQCDTCYQMFRPSALKEAFANGKTDHEYEFPVHRPGQLPHWLNLKLRMMCKPGSGELIAFFNLREVTREHTLRRVVELLEKTEFDGVSVLNVATGEAMILHGSDLDEVTQMQKRLRSSAAGVEAHLRRHCLPEDVERTVQQTSMASVVQALQDKPLYSVHYRTKRADGIHYKRADYRYLDESKALLLCTIQDFTFDYRALK